MSCRNPKEDYYDREIVGNVGTGGFGCVKETIRRILDAQRRVAGDTGYDCDTSCDQSIDDLLSPRRDHSHPRHTTIPFMLVCKDACNTFFGSGFINHGHDRHGRFECVESPVFKVKGFVGGSNNCVRLELLSPVQHHHQHDGDGDSCELPINGSSGGCGCKGSVCGFFNRGPIDNFCYTGVCITVNLDCFCGISCLDPITPSR